MHLGAAGGALHGRWSEMRVYSCACVAGGYSLGGVAELAGVRGFGPVVLRLPGCPGLGSEGAGIMDLGDVPDRMVSSRPLRVSVGCFCLLWVLC